MAHLVEAGDSQRQLHQSDKGGDPDGHVNSVLEVNCDHVLALILFSYFIMTGLFDKAKKKILKAIDDEDDIQGAGFSASVYTTTSVTGYDPSFWEPQELGNSLQETNIPLS